MPFVNVRLVRQAIADAPQAKKDEMGREIVKAISKVTGLDEQLVWVTFEEVDDHDWFVGQKNVREIRAAAK
jgi:4-oxalocrotonate tautomerase